MSRADNDLLKRAAEWIAAEERKPRDEIIAAIAVILMLVGAFAVLTLGA